MPWTATARAGSSDTVNASSGLRQGQPRLPYPRRVTQRECRGGDDSRRLLRASSSSVSLISTLAFRPPGSGTTQTKCAEAGQPRRRASRSKRQGSSRHHVTPASALSAHRLRFRRFDRLRAPRHHPYDSDTRPLMPGTRVAVDRRVGRRPAAHVRPLEVLRVGEVQHAGAQRDAVRRARPSRDDRPRQRPPARRSRRRPSPVTGRATARTVSSLPQRFERAVYCRPTHALIRARSCSAARRASPETSSPRMTA